MPSPNVHAFKGLAIAGALLKVAEPQPGELGLAGTVALPLAIALVGYVSHLPLDCIPHLDTVAASTKEDYDLSMAGNPLAPIHDVGIWPVFLPNGRQILRETHPELADPEPITVRPIPMRLAVIDISVACLVTFVVLLPYLMHQPYLWLCLGAGAFGVVLPDALLAKPIHDRLIKQTWFWRLDYFHHWIHAPVMKWEDRLAGLISQLVLLAIFVWLAWINHPLL